MRLDGSLRVGSHDVSVALLPSRQCRVESVDGAGERVGGVAVLGDRCCL